MSKLHSFAKLSTTTALCSSLVSTAFAGTPSPQVTESTARASALAAIPSGAVQSSELETEGGRQIWSFDIKEPTSTDVVEVQIDARTGLIVSKKRETRADQKREAQADQGQTLTGRKLFAALPTARHSVKVAVHRNADAHEAAADILRRPMLR